MHRHGAILNLGGPLADGDHIEDMSLSTLCVVALGATHMIAGWRFVRTAKDIDSEAEVASPA
jgi:hypothetical protein